MPNIGSLFVAKNLALTYQPLLLATFEFSDGSEPFRVCTHDLTADNSHQAQVWNPRTKLFEIRYAPRSFAYTNPATAQIEEYEARILNQDIAATQALSEDGIDITPTVSLKMADPDNYIWQLYEYDEYAPGFKGAKLTLKLVLWDVAGTSPANPSDLGSNIFAYDREALFTTDALTIFVGQCNPATITEDGELSVSAVSKLNMKKIMLPTIQIQKRCPWVFPTKEPQWNLVESRDSEFYYCGYDNGKTRGNAGYSACAYSKQECELRGMYLNDSAGRKTGSFGGIQFDLASNNLMDWSGKEYVSGTKMEGKNTPNLGKYGDYVPLIYGTSWVDTVVLEVLGDPNSTRGEALVCLGEVADIVSVIVNDTMCPPAQFRNTGLTSEQAQSIQAEIDLLRLMNVVHVGALDDQIASLQNQLNELSIPIKIAYNSTPIVIETSGPHGLVTGQRVHISGVNSDGTHGDNSANGTWSIVVNNDTQFALIGSAGNQNYTGGGWVSTAIPSSNTLDIHRWQPVNWGGRQGSPCTDAIFDGKGDPFGNLCAIEWVVPRSVTSSNSVPRVRALVQGPRIPVFNSDSPTDFTLVGAPLNENPVWQMLDILTKSHWKYEEIDIASFMKAAAICDEQIEFVDAFGNTEKHQRFATCFNVHQRKSAADILRTLRLGCNALLLPNVNGKLQILIKQGVKDQQPAPIVGSNSNEQVNGGYLAYDFTESDIKRDGNGKTTFRVSQLPIQQTPNKIRVQFQDKENAYQMDALSVIDDYDYNNVGEVDTTMNLDYVNSFDHAQRILTTLLAELHKGNPSGTSRGTLQFSFETTVKAAHLHVGDIIRVTCLAKGVDHVMARITSIQPATNFETAKIVCQWHEDFWYLDAYGQGKYDGDGNTNRTYLNRPPYPWHPAAALPHPKDPNMFLPESSFYVEQFYENQADGTPQAYVRIQGYYPINKFSQYLRPPSMKLKGSVVDGGQASGPNVMWGCVCLIDDQERLSPPSDLTRFDVPKGSSYGLKFVGKYKKNDKIKGFATFVGSDPNNMCWYSTVDIGAQDGKINYVEPCVPHPKLTEPGAPQVMAVSAGITIMLTNRTSDSGWHIGDTFTLDISGAPPGVPVLSDSTTNGVVRSDKVYWGLTDDSGNFKIDGVWDTTYAWGVWDQGWYVGGEKLTFSMVVDPPNFEGLLGTPDLQFDHLTIKAKQIIHGGVFGTQITAVGENTIEVKGAGWEPDQWRGRFCVVVSNRDARAVGTDALTPIWNFKVLSNTSEVLTLEPDPKTDDIGVEEGDAIIMRMQPDMQQSTTSKIVDPLWRNSVNPYGTPMEILSVVSAGDGKCLLETEVHGFNGDRGTVFVSGVVGTDEANGVHAYEVVDDTHVKLTDATFVNAYVSGGTIREKTDGLVPNFESGNIFRVVYGTGRGQTRVIDGNDRTSITLRDPLSCPLDLTSVAIIEEPNWPYVHSTDTVENYGGLVCDMTIPVANFVGETLLVMGASVDTRGRESFEYFNPFREIYMFGAPGDAYIRDWSARFVITEDPMQVEDDAMNNHYRVRCNKGEYVSLIDLSIQAKTAPVGADAAFDIKVSADGGQTWETILTENAKLADGSVASYIPNEKIKIQKLYRDQLLRLDITGIGISVPGGQIELALKGKIFATS